MWGKDDGDYDSHTSQDEILDEKYIYEKEAKKEKKNQTNKKWEKKREGAMLLSFYHTCDSK